MTIAMFAALRRLGVVLAFAGLVLAAGPGSALADSTLTQGRAQELRLYDSVLVLARPGAAPCPSPRGRRQAREGAAGLAAAQRPCAPRSPSLDARRSRTGGRARPAAEPRQSPRPTRWSALQWWPSFVGLDRAEPPGPGKPLTIIDTGVDLTHEEFVGRPATVALNAQSTAARYEEHGTAVASTAAAPTNGVGIVGVYPQANLQVWDASPSGDGITAGDVIQGLDAAIRSGQGVVNLSLGSHIQNPLLDAMVAVTFAKGTLIVAAAGNSREDGSPLEYPASLPHVLTAGAIDQSGQPTFFSSGSQYVDLAAPGWDIRGRSARDLRSHRRR